MKAAYLTLSQKELGEKLSKAMEIYSECHLCPHNCRKNRLQDSSGFCQSGVRLKISSFVQHLGEEKVLNRVNGVGNIFLSSCNMRCDYCQNYQISHLNYGEYFSYEEVANEMLSLQSKGVHFIGWVSPSHFVPGLINALSIARDKGLVLPIIYNSNGYDSLEILRLLDGLIDVYLPDIKYSDNVLAKKYSKIDNYFDFAKTAAFEMYRQVGPLLEDEFHLTNRGLLIRHLVLPGNIAGSWEVLCFIALELSTKVPVSIMNQYKPVYNAKENHEINTTISEKEYKTVLQMAIDLGFETIYTQDFVEKHNLPNFNKKRPFDFD